MDAVAGFPAQVSPRNPWVGRRMEGGQVLALVSWVGVPLRLVAAAVCAAVLVTAAAVSPQMKHGVDIVRGVVSGVLCAGEHPRGVGAAYARRACATRNIRRRR